MNSRMLSRRKLAKQVPQVMKSGEGWRTATVTPDGPGPPEVRRKDLTLGLHEDPGGFYEATTYNSCQFD